MLEFERFHAGNLEEALEVRNVAFVRERMLYSAPISIEQHIRWFSEINNNANFYFLVRLHGEAIGVINIKGFDSVESKAELGIFFGKEQIINSVYPVICAFTLQDFALEILGIKNLYTKVKKEMSDVIQFNEIMALEFERELESHFIYVLNPEKAKHITRRYRKAALALSSTIHHPEIFRIQFDDNDTENGCRAYLEQCILNSRAYKSGQIEFR
jgi:hypothetical protein